MSYELLIKLVGCNSFCCVRDYSRRVMAREQTKVSWKTNELQRTEESRGHNSRQREHCRDYSGQHFDTCFAANCTVGGTAGHDIAFCRRVECFQSRYLVFSFAIFWSVDHVPHTHVRTKTQCSEKSMDGNTFWTTAPCAADWNGAPSYWPVLHHV